VTILIEIEGSRGFKEDVKESGKPELMKQKSTEK